MACFFLDSGFRRNDDGDKCSVTLTPAQIEFDDSGRLVSTGYGDIYFQPENARAESEYVFLKQGGFYDALEDGGDLTMAELGFGTGLNFMLCAEKWKANPERGSATTHLRETNSTGWLHFVSFEKHPILKSDLKKIHALWPELAEWSARLIDHYPILTEGVHRLVFEDCKLTLTLALGDVADTLPDMDFKADCWFLDGFAPAKNPDMWQENLWPALARNTKQGGRFASFTAAGAVRRGLEAAGFHVEKTKGFGRKRDMSVGYLKNPPALQKFDMKHIPVPRDFLNARGRPWSTPRAAKDVTVIGAGIAGCALAESLTRYGHKVTLVDRHDEIAQEASGNPLAAVYPKLGAVDSMADRFYRAAFCYTQNFYHHLENSSFESCGVFQLDRTDDAHSRHLKIAARGLPDDLVVYLERDTVTGLDLPQGGLFMPKGGTVSPPSLCRALLDKAEKTGLLTLRLSHDVPERKGIRIIANGIGLAGFAETRDIPIEVVRGQITQWHGTPETHGLKTVICHKGYLTPRRGGLHVLGATFDKGAADNAAPLPENHQRNLEQLAKELPLCGNDSIYAQGGRTGNRAATPDRLPLCGAVPDSAAFQKDFAALTHDAAMLFDNPPLYYDDVYVLGALGSHGMTSAPYLAEIIAAQLSDRPLPITRSLYNALIPARFPARKLAKSEK